MQAGAVVENTVVWIKLSLDAVFSMLPFMSDLWIGLSPKPCSGVILESYLKKPKAEPENR